MDLKSGQPFWSVRDGLPQVYPRLSESIAADVLVIGAGITGAVIAHRLAQAGLSVIVLDRRDVAAGSTCASTALLQYETDVSLVELAELLGTPNAVAVYRSALDAIGAIAAISRELNAGRFQPRSSLYFASEPEDAGDLQREAAFRQQHGFPVEYWNADRIRTQFDFLAPGAIYSRSGGEIDPYELTHALLQFVCRRGGRVFDRTAVESWECNADSVRVETDGGHQIIAKWVVVAAGYESQSFLPEPVASLHSTYAFVSEPLSSFEGWHERCLIWETARPYLYVRGTDDNRLMAGGGDVPFRNEWTRDRLRERKVEAIASRVRDLFPRIPFEIDFSWAGTFAETPDGLPYIGPHPERPRFLFALCYGGNGIPYAVGAAHLISDFIAGRQHPLATVVGFDRPSVAEMRRMHSKANR